MAKKSTFLSIYAVLSVAAAALVYLLGVYIGDEPNPMRWSGSGRLFHVVFTLAAMWLMLFAANELDSYLRHRE